MSDLLQSRFDCHAHAAVSLILSTVHSEAIQLIENERQILALTAADPNAKKSVENAIKHLDYLQINWIPEVMWRCWSQYGRNRASGILGIPVEGVLPTTNHLESFNAILKRNHLTRWLHSGHRLRFDSFIHILITRILPDIYSQRRAMKAHRDWVTARFAGLTRNGARQADAGSAQLPLAYWCVDEKREEGARDLIRLRKLGQIQYGNSQEELIATCATSTAVLNDPNHVRYSLVLWSFGTASCTCVDFSLRGGACKHLRAMRIVVNEWISAGQIAPITYPETYDDALAIRNRHHSSSEQTALAFEQSATSIPAPPPVPSLSSSSTALQSLVDLETLVSKGPETTDDPEASSVSEVESDCDEVLPENNVNAGLPLVCCGQAYNRALRLIFI